MIYNTSSKNSLNIACELILKDEIIIYPTDTLYGFGVDATNNNAIKKLNKLKNRIQPYSIIVDSMKMLKVFAKIDKHIEDKLHCILPGPYTAILNKNDSILSDLVTCNLNTIGIRIPKNQFILDIVSKIKKPIITTSVNKHKKKSLNTLSDIKAEYSDINIFYNNEDINSNGSTIIDFTTDPYKILRKGDGAFSI